MGPQPSQESKASDAYTLTHILTGRRIEAHMHHDDDLEGIIACLQSRGSKQSSASEAGTVLFCFSPSPPCDAGIVCIPMSTGSGFMSASGMFLVQPSTLLAAKRKEDKYIISSLKINKRGDLQDLLDDNNVKLRWTLQGPVASKLSEAATLSRGAYGSALRNSNSKNDGERGLSSRPAMTIQLSLDSENLWLLSSDSSDPPNLILKNCDGITDNEMQNYQWALETSSPT